MEEDDDETKKVMEAKLTGVAAGMGVKLESTDISMIHRTCKPDQGNRSVVVRFSLIIKIKELKNKKKLYKKTKDFC